MSSFIVDTAGCQLHVFGRVAVPTRTQLVRSSVWFQVKTTNVTKDYLKSINPKGPTRSVIEGVPVKSSLRSIIVRADVLRELLVCVVVAP